MEKEPVGHLKNTDESVMDLHDNIDLIDIYFSEIPKTLLDIDTEVELSKIIQKSTDAARVLKTGCDSLDLERKNELEAIIQAGGKARNTLICSNLRLVVSIAKKYLGRGLPFEDLIEEGNLGLMKAADKYDWKRGFRFSTYATSCIKSSISKMIDNQGRAISIPSYMANQIRMVNKYKEQLIQELGREPTDEELAKGLDINLLSLKNIKNSCFDPISLDMNIHEDEDNSASLGDFITDRNKLYNSEPENDKRNRINNILLTKGLSKLDTREIEMLELRFGLNGKGEHTLQEIGNGFQISRERVRQIQEKAFIKLKFWCS